MGTVPTGLPLSMSTVRTALGGTAGTTQLSAYVRGGAFVGNFAPNLGVPTAVPITLSQLQGASTTASYSASASPSSVIGSRITSGVATTSPSCAVIVTGGGGTKTYSWTRASGDTSTSISSSTSASVTWNRNCTVATVQYTSVWSCTVTDTVSGTTTTNNVAVELDYTP